MEKWEEFPKLSKRNMENIYLYRENRKYFSISDDT